MTLSDLAQRFLGMLDAAVKPERQSRRSAIWFHGCRRNLILMGTPPPCAVAGQCMTDSITEIFS
jgi:hypothetical protein